MEADRAYRQGGVDEAIRVARELQAHIGRIEGSLRAACKQRDDAREQAVLLFEELHVTRGRVQDALDVAHSLEAGRYGFRTEEAATDIIAALGGE